MYRGHIILDVEINEEQLDVSSELEDFAKNLAAHVLTERLVTGVNVYLREFRGEPD